MDYTKNNVFNLLIKVFKLKQNIYHLHYTYIKKDSVIESTAGYVK